MNKVEEKEKDITDKKVVDANKTNKEPVKEKTNETNEVTDEAKSVHLAKVNKSLQNMEVLTELSQIEAFAKYVIYSKLAPESFETAKDAAVALMMGNELGFKPMTSLQNINVISGKPALTVNAYTSKMLQNGITYKILHDFETENVYKDDKGTEYTHKEVIDNPELYFIYDSKKNKPEDAKKAVEIDKKILLVFSRSDKFTEIEFSREVKQKSGKWKEWNITHRIYIQEIVDLGLTARDQWKKQKRTMLRTRVLTAGARLIAPDCFTGIYTDIELKDMRGDDYAFDESKGTTVVNIEEATVVES